MRGPDVNDDLLGGGPEAVRRRHDEAHGKRQGEPLLDPWERFIVPAFPLDILAPVLRDFVASQSLVIGGCLSGMAMATLATVSAATSHRWSLKVMEHGQWYAHPRLWVLLVGDPAVKKTPEMEAACKPLERLQAELYRDHKAAMRQWEDAGNKDDPEPEPPPRYVVIDVTTQKLGEILARADRGTLIKRDELTGWIGEMDRYSNATRASSDRAFWLKAWDGGPYNYDRIGRGELFIENLSVSVLGGIQPDRLAELKNLTSDGLLQRFLPVIMTEASFTLDEPTNVNPYWALIRHLVDLPPQHLSMTNDALTCNKERLLASDLTTNIRDLRGLSLFQVRERVSSLVAGGWLDPVDRTPTCKAWRVNPAVKLKFAEQERKEAERKRIITEMLRLKKA